MKSEPEHRPASRAGHAAGGGSIEDVAAAWVARSDAGLSAGEDAEFHRWLESDARHQAAFDEYRSAWAALDRPAAGGMADELLARVRGLDRRRTLRRALAGAVAAAVLLVGFSLWSIDRERRSGRESAPTATSRVVGPERRSLPDGSVVELRDGAEIAQNFSGGQRRVILQRGEAHFQVTKDAARPFFVEANGVEFRAVGTAFVVQIRPSALELIVTEGSVAVEKPARAASVSSGPIASAHSPAPVLVAGERALVDPGSAGVDVRAIGAPELSARLAWRAPRLEFSGMPLAGVVALLNQYADERRGIRLKIADPEIAQVRVSGLFQIDNTDALLDLLDSGFGIVAERQGGSEVVLRKAPTPP